jgi:hypothetical protein
MPDITPVEHLVLVDFENVPTVDLDAIGALPVVVMLFIGKNQTKVDTALFEQAHRHAAKVKLIPVGASGRNALDLVLAHYLGRAVVDSPNAELHIVSKDKDFDPLITHLRSKGVKVSRSDAFAALPFLPNQKPTGLPRKPAPARKKSAPVAAATTHDDKLERLIARLENNRGPRPKRKKRLLSHVSTAYGNKLTEVEVAEIVDRLIARGVLKIDGADRVTY